MLFRIENTSLVSAVVKTYIFLAFGITRYLHYGRIIDKLNKSCAIALFSVNLRITKNGAIVEKRGILCLPYLLNEFGDLTFFLRFYFLHIINFKREKSRQILMSGTITAELP